MSKVDPDPDELRLRGEALYEQGQYRPALEALLTFLEGVPAAAADPQTNRVLASAMDCAFELALWPQLESLAQRTIKAFPLDTAGPARLAEALEAQGRTDHQLHLEVKTAKKSAAVRRVIEVYDQAHAQRKQGHVDQALTGYLEVLSYFPVKANDGPFVKSLKAAFECAVETSNWPAAQAVAERKIGAFPKDPQAFEQLAQALQQQGRAAEAAVAQIRADHLNSASAPPQVTILTVVLEGHYKYIRQQLALIEALNPATAFKLLVVDNSGAGEPGLAIDHPRCEIIAGVEQDPSLPEHGRGSYHHAAALNLALERVDTPYLLVLDPDFFVIYRNWIAEALDHMRRRSLTLFGAPWHYSWNRKWRYFPCVHFLMIDLARIGLKELDFTPALAGDPDSSDAPVQRWLRKYALTLHNRLLLESRRDTGWLLHERFRRSHGADVTLPVVDTRTEFRSPARLETPFGRWLERRVPRRISFLPAPGTYVESDRAYAFRHPAIRSLAPEKFVWRGAPFAVHLRGNMREDMRTSANPPHKERAATKELLDAVAGASSWAEWAFGIATQD